MVKPWQRYEDKRTGFKVTDRWLEKNECAICFGTYAVPHSVEWERGCRICKKELLRKCMKATKKYWHKYLTDDFFTSFFDRDHYEREDEGSEFDVLGKKSRKFHQEGTRRVRERYTVHERP